MRTLDVCRRCWIRNLETRSRWRSREGMCEMREGRVMLQNDVTVTSPLCHPVSLRSGRKSREDQMGLLPISRKEVGTRLGVAGGQVIHSTRLSSVEKKCVRDLFSNEILIGLAMSSFVVTNKPVLFYGSSLFTSSLLAGLRSAGAIWPISGSSSRDKGTAE